MFAARAGSSDMNRFNEFLLCAILIVISGIPRLIGLGSFTSLDEPFWLRQGANFYYALGQRAFANTIYEYHPAVTTMWVITAGMLLYFPQYRALGEGYLKPGKFDLFLPEHGKDPLQLLVTSRAVQVAIVILLLVATYLLLRRLFDARSAFLATGLIALSPFFLGHSRLLNHEALLGLFILISVLSMLLFLSRERKLRWLLISSTAAGLAQLTKSSAILLIPAIFLMVAVNLAGSLKERFRSNAFAAARTFGIWLLALAVAYILFWPGMWVAPGQMLSEVYGNAFTYAFQGSRLSVVGHVDPSGFGLATLGAGLQFYVTDLVWRTTPLTWLGVLVGLAIAAGHLRTRTHSIYELTLLYAGLLAISFVLLFSLQRGPKPPHYTLTSYIMLDLIAGLGLARGLEILVHRVPWLTKVWIPWTAVGLFLIVQAASAAPFHPYYITYFNPVLESLQPGIQNPTLDGTGYGVGLDQAAAYLAQKADAKDLTVLAANGYGCFSYYFPGHTVPINNFTLSDPQILAVLPTSRYAVVDYYNQKRSNLVSDFQGIAPEKVIWIDGIDFLHIYRISDFSGRLAATTPPGAEATIPIAARFRLKHQMK